MGDNTNLPSDINTSKTVGVGIAFIATVLKEYSISFLMVCRLIDFALVVLELLMYKGCGIIGISRIEFFNFSGNQRANDQYSFYKETSQLICKTSKMTGIYISGLLVVNGITRITGKKT